MTIERELTGKGKRIIVTLCQSSKCFYAVAFDIIAEPNLLI